VLTGHVILHSLLPAETLIKRSEGKRAPAAASGGGAAAGAADGSAPPNKILFAQNLPEASTSQMLTLLFNQYPGFIEVSSLLLLLSCCCLDVF
jgi:hypothetical protein